MLNGKQVITNFSQKAIGAFAIVAIAAVVLLLGCALLPSASAHAQTLETAALTADAGTTFTVDGNVYKITERYKSAHDLGEVKLVKYGSTNKAPKVNTVKHEGKTYEVEEVGKNAFNNKRGHRVTSVTLGRYVDEIESKAFYGCSKLKVLNVAKSDVIDIERSKKTGSYYIDDMDIGPKAFKGAGVKDVKVKCGKSSAAYQQLVKKALVSKGMRSTAQVVK